MITTSRKELHDRLKILRQHGMSVNDRQRHQSNQLIFEEHVEVGYNYRMTDIQASVGIKQLEKLNWIISERRKIAAKYNESFKSLDCITLPREEEGYFTNYQSYCLYLKGNAPVTRNELMESLLRKGISTRRGIMTSHREPAYKELYQNLKLPVSENLSDRSLILPLYVGMTDNDTRYITSVLIELLKNRKGYK